MDALKRSLANERQAPPPASKAKKPKKRIEGQREMLLPISGKRTAKEDTKAEPKAPAAKKPVRNSARAKKAG
jgi:DNA end-binding protein Ku